jgi:hypothetical protein
VPEACLTGGGIFLVTTFLALGILGTGIALSQIGKMKAKMEKLEQRLWNIPVASAAPAAE